MWNVLLLCSNQSTIYGKFVVDLIFAMPWYGSNKRQKENILNFKEVTSVATFGSKT